MANYKKMYTLLCKTIDGVIDPLAQIPQTACYAERLQEALLQAEEIYITTTPYAEETNDPKVIQLKTDKIET